MREAKTILSSMTASLTEFISQLLLSKSKTTVDAYKYDIGKFIEYMEQEARIKKPASIKPKHITDYLGYCKYNGKSDASVNRYYMAIRSYCKFLRRSGLVTFDLTQDITAPRNNIKAPRIPTTEEIARLMQQPDLNTEHGMRDRAIMELLYSSGLRASELCSLQLHHVGPRKVMVSCGKRSKTRTVPLTAEAFAWVDRYILHYRGNERGPLFLTPMGKEMRRQYLCAMIGKYAARAGLEEVTTHTLRHACATHLLDAGADLRLIQEVLGHSTIASTQRYTHLSSSKMEEMFTHFHPRKTTMEHVRPFEWEELLEKEDDDGD